MDEFLEDVRRLCQRPGMFVLDGSLVEVTAYLTGYARGAPDCPLGGEGWIAFSTWVNARLGFPDNIAWPASLRRAVADDQEGLALLQELLEDFVEALQTCTPAEIEQRCRAADVDPSQPENRVPSPEGALRAFLLASLRGRREDIEPLILPHDEAHRLWQGAYPDDVADLLAEEWSRARIGRVRSTSPDESRVQLVCSMIPGQVTVVRVGGQWLVDAVSLIEARRLTDQAK